MTRFAYRAVPLQISSLGGAREGAGRSRVVEGREEASDERSLRESLRKQGLIPLEVRPVNRVDAIRQAMQGGRLSGADVCWFFQTLRQLLEGKAPIETAVATMQELAPRPRLAAACAQVRDALRTGSSLAAAVERVPALADPQALALLHVGHEAGRLQHSVELIDRALQRRRRIRKTVIGRLTYPAVVLVVAVVAIFILASFVIPSFARTLASVGAELPLSTRITLAASRWAVWLGPILLIAVVAGVVFRPAQLPPAWRRRLHEGVLRLPVVGSLVWHGQASVVTDTLATILEGGGDVLVGLEQARRALWSDVIRDRLDRVRSRVRDGGELGEALAEERVLPPMASAIIRVGMKSGDLTESLKRAADLCNEKQEEVTGRLLTLMEPAIILFLATIVGWVFYSLISGILTINDIGAM